MKGHRVRVHFDPGLSVWQWRCNTCGRVGPLVRLLSSHEGDLAPFLGALNVAGRRHAAEVERAA